MYEERGMALQKIIWKKSFTYIADHVTTITESMYGKPELKSDRLSKYTLKHIKIRKLNSIYSR